MLQNGRSIPGVIGQKAWRGLMRACGGKKEAGTILRQFEIRQALDPKLEIAVGFAANRDKRTRDFTRFAISKLSR